MKKKKKNTYRGTKNIIDFLSETMQARWYGTTASKHYKKKINLHVLEENMSEFL